MKERSSMMTLLKGIVSKFVLRSPYFLEISKAQPKLVGC